MKIVSKNASHTADLERIFLQARQNAFHWLDAKKLAPEDFEWQTQGEFILVALIDEKAVGFISLWLPDRFIHHLYVDEKYRQQQIGTKLLAAAIEKMSFPIRLKCLEQNTKALAFYKKNGFVQKENGISDEGKYFLYELA